KKIKNYFFFKISGFIYKIFATMLGPGGPAAGRPHKRGRPAQDGQGRNAIFHPTKVRTHGNLPPRMTEG
ncbi:MAG: hypothetical protein ABF854_11370, partial [Gluconacetobacter sp.]